MLCARSSDQCERERERGCTRKRVRVAHLTSHPFCGKASMFVSSAAAPRLSLLPIILSTLSHHPKCDSSKGLKTSPIHAVARERGEKNAVCDALSKFYYTHRRRRHSRPCVRGFTHTLESEATIAFELIYTYSPLPSTFSWRDVCVFADGEQVGFARESPRVCLKRTALCLEGRGWGGTCTLLIVLSWSMSSGTKNQVPLRRARLPHLIRRSESSISVPPSSSPVSLNF